MNVLYYIPIIENNNLDKVLKYASQERKQIIQGYKSEIDKKIYIYTGIFVKMMAAKILNLPYSKIEIGKMEYGKPYIKNNPSFHYNCSHTKNAFCIVFSNEPVGIDIEKIERKSYKNFYNVAKRFFSENEFLYFFSNGNEDIECFFEIWTKKEAYLKLKGTGLNTPLSSFCVFDEKISNKFKSLKKDNNYISLCCNTESTTFKFIELNENDILNMLKNIKII